MQQLTPHPLWLGHLGEGRNLQQLFDAGIQALVELAAEEAPSHPPRELIYCRFPLLDGADNDRKVLYLAASTVASLLERGVPTLVCCGSGLSRSPALAAAALALVYQEPPEECLKQIAQQHRTDISPGLWNQLVGLIDSARLP
jgi:protein-tyrosine phosphatase